MKNTKKTRRVAAFAAAVMMAACVAVPMSSFSASAAENTVTFIGGTVGTHQYTAYQIFSGDAAKNGFNSATGTNENVELKNVNWAMDATNASAFLTALKNDARFGEGDANVFKDCTTAAGVAKVLKNYTYNSQGAKDFADFVVEQATKTSGGITFPTTTAASGAEELSITVDGYYVIAETTLTPDTAGNGAMTAYLLGVYDASAGADIQVKAALPTFQKKIKDFNDSGTTDGSTNNVWQDSADHDITDDVPFQLTATLPTDYANYKTYKLVFHDDLQNEVFTLNKDSIKVYYQKGTGDPTVIDAAKYNVVTEGFSEDDVFKSKKTDGTTDFTVTFANLKDETTGISEVGAGDKIIIEYTAKLTDKAKIGAEGNWNSGYLEYSNNPNFIGEGAPTTSHTPEDLVVAFTYELDVNKVDGQTPAQPLKGAGFTLQKHNGTDYVNVGTEIKGEDLTTFVFKGLDAGKYKLVESTVPDGYNSAADTEFELSATHDETADVPALKTLTVNKSTLTANKDSGKVSTTIVNTSGASLPSTGGIGTTLFYVGGGVLVAGAGVLLITKKRAKKDAE